MSNQELILYDVKDQIATITINRPEKANACNTTMLEAIYNNIIQADEDEKVKCILIKSAGDRFFSAGYDLKEIQGDPSRAAKVHEFGRKINETILLLKKPVITQIQGIAIGFGALLVLSSDLRIFADRPKEELYIMLPELAIAAFTQTGAALLPILAFGLSVAKNLFYTSDKIGIDELRNLNFPTRIFPFDQLENETLLFAKQVSSYDTKFMFILKPLLTAIGKRNIKSCFDLEDECGDFYRSKELNSIEDLENFTKEIHKRLT